VLRYSYRVDNESLASNNKSGGVIGGRSASYWRLSERKTGITRRRRYGGPSQPWPLTSFRSVSIFSESEDIDPSHPETRTNNE
jgi:hypothetical protein